MPNSSNNYNKNIYNGDVGRIAKIDRVEQEVMVIIDGREIVYDFSELDELVLAYAVSVHKYQGSECPCVPAAGSRRRAELDDASSIATVAGASPG